MASITYSLCMLTALTCTCLLLRAWRRSGYRLLFWSGLCFAGLTLNNLALVIDKVVLPSVDLSMWRTSMALLAMAVLLLWLDLGVGMTADGAHGTQAALAEQQADGFGSAIAMVPRGVLTITARLGLPPPA